MTRRGIIGLAIAAMVIGTVAGYAARPSLDLWAFDEVTVVAITDRCPLGWIAVDRFPQVQAAFDGPFDETGRRIAHQQMCVWERML